MQYKPYLPIALALGLAATSALAAPPAGQLLASQCAQCHGTNGNGPGFDKLSGSSAREISNEMLEMKARSIPEGIMGRQAHGYTDAQIQLIADYLSGQNSGTSGVTSGGGTSGSTVSAASDKGSLDSASGKTQEKKKGNKVKSKVSKNTKNSSKTTGSRRG